MRLVNILKALFGAAALTAFAQSKNALSVDKVTGACEQTVNFTAPARVGGVLIASQAYSDGLVRTHETRSDNPHGVTASQTGAIATPASPAQGDILYYTGSAWARLAAGTSGYFFQTQGAGANPQWAAASGGSGTNTPAFADIMGSPRDNAALAAYTPDTSADSLVAGDNNKFVVPKCDANFGDATLNAIKGNLLHAWGLASTADALGSITLTNTGSIVFTTDGVNGKAASGFATNQWLTLPSSEQLTSGAFSLSLWIKNPTDGTTVCEFPIGGNNFLFMTNSGSVYIGFRGVSAITGNYSFASDVWYHVVVTWSGSEFTVTANGSAVSVSGTGAPGGSSSTYGIGNQSGGGYPFSGAIDEFYVFNVVLTSDQKNALYSSGAGRFYAVSGYYTVGSGAAEFITHSRNEQTDTSYTLALSDKNKSIFMTNASANTVIVPLHSSVAFPYSTTDMTTIPVFQMGAGTTAVSVHAGATLNGVSAGSASSAGQYKNMVLRAYGSDTWVVTGGAE